MGWSELILIGVVALIVVGPKDLPVMFQALGKMTAKMRRMAREFSSSMNEAAHSSGATDIARDMRNLTSSKSLGMDALKEAADKFDKWEPGAAPKAVGLETARLTQERMEKARKIQEKSAEIASRRLAAEAEALGQANQLAKTEAPASAPAKEGAEVSEPAVKPKPKPKTKTKTKVAPKTKTKAAPKAKTKSKAQATEKPAGKTATKARAQTKSTASKDKK